MSLAHTAIFFDTGRYRYSFICQVT